MTDVYKDMAARAYNIPVEEVTPEQRAYMKRVFWWKLYSGKGNVVFEQPIKKGNL